MKKKFKDSEVLSGNFLRQLFFIMKLTLFFLITSTLGLFATESYSQNTRITLDLRSVPVREALKAIENESEFYFIYNNELINVDREIDISVKNQKITEVLNNIFEGKDVEITVIDRKIVLSPAYMGEQQPNKKISGKVTDSTGATLPGVSVVVKGTAIGVITDANGSYSLPNTPSTAILVFSFVGMKLQEITIGNKSIIDVVLAEETIGIEEVVAVGYGTQRKKDIIGSVSVVNMKSLKSISTGSAVSALQGQASGVTIVGGGAPGTPSQITVRGMSSFGNNTPLVLVDGIEGNLDNVNSTEIESVQVLKDAGSAAIYGVRGSNGVIIVTTKKGKAGAPVVTYDAYAGVQMPLSGNPFNLVNSQEWWKLMGQGFPNDPMFKTALPDYMYRAPGGNPKFAFEGDPAVDPSKYFFDASNAGNSYIIAKVNKDGTDWFHEVFKPAMRSNQTLTVSGGTDKSRYLFSVNALDENGTVIETNQKRYSARINSDFNIGKHIRIGENINIYTNSIMGNTTGQWIGENNPISYINSSLPIAPVYDISGTHYLGPFAIPPTQAAGNPVYNQKSQYNNRNNNWVINGNAYVEVDFLKHFTARTSIGGSILNNYSINFVPTDYTSLTAYNGLNRLAESSGYALYKIWTNTLKYDNSFGKHKISVIGGSEAVEYSGRSQWGQRQDFYLTDFSYLLLGNGKSLTDNSSSAYINTLYSLFGRLDYAYNDKYLLGATIRRDGSSKFGADSRFGIFPSVSLGWRVSGEQFMKNVTWINDLKIRASYGELGSQSNVDNANAFSLYGTNKNTTWYGIAGNVNSTTQGFVPSRFGNSSTGWEKDIISNVGLDATIFDKIDLTVEIYKKNVSGLLFPQPLPNTAGGATPPNINIGDVENKGFDISGNYRGTVGNDLKFTVGANLTHYTNTITSIPGSNPFFDNTAASTRAGIYVRNEVGHSIGEFYGYQVERLFQSAADVAASPTQQGAGPGTFKYKDINGTKYEDGKPDGKIDALDRTFMGSPHPKFTYGINLGLNYKNFDFATNLYGSYGNKVINNVKSFTYFSYFKWQLNRELLNAWSPTNTSSNIPTYTGAGSFSLGSVPNSFLVEDGSFLKCRSMVLGYTLPASLLDKVKVSKIRVYVQAMNLFQITKYSGLDPEIPGNNGTGDGVYGADLGSYPNNEKQFLIGVNISF
jgi:TonB-linked SusC/RagA family outer membrane protein